MTCQTCKHAQPAPKYADDRMRHCALQPYGLPLASWAGIRCAWHPVRWERG